MAWWWDWGRHRRPCPARGEPALSLPGLPPSTGRGALIRGSALPDGLLVVVPRPVRGEGPGPDEVGGMLPPPRTTPNPSRPMADASPDPLAQALGRIPSGLFLVTTELGGAPLGFLGSFVMQVGFDPPTVCVAVEAA